MCVIFVLFVIFAFVGVEGFVFLKNDVGASNFHMFKQYKNSLLASNMYWSSWSPDLPYLQNKKLIMPFDMEGSSNGGLPKCASTDVGFEFVLSSLLSGFKMLLRSSLNKKKYMCFESASSSRHIRLNKVSTSKTICNRRFICWSVWELKFFMCSSIWKKIILE